MTENSKADIAAGKWVHCKICEDIFARKRETMRYCSKCKNGFCEGEHGFKTPRGHFCIKCSV